MPANRHPEATHVRQRPPKRSPHRQGRITPENVLDQDPRTRTLCGAAPTALDLSHQSARAGARRGDLDRWMACPACTAALEGEVS